MDNSEVDAALFDSWTRDYALLGLYMERLAPGTVDSWIGPASWRTEIEADALPVPGDLLATAENLLERLPNMGYTPDRRGYLQRQVQAVHTQARVLMGETLPLDEQAQLLFDVRPERVSEDIFAAAHAQLERLLPGNGPLPTRYSDWKRGFQAPAEQVMPLLPIIEAEVRARTVRYFPLPDGEGIEVRLVANQPWGAYNSYLGGFHSLIEINTDLPMQVDGLIGYLCHEGYPGHHTEHASREAVQYRGGHQGEYAIQLINTPENLISEAIATSARELVFSGDEDLKWGAEAIFPQLGLRLDLERDGRIRTAIGALRSVSGNAAFLLHEDGAAAEDVVSYIERWSLRSHVEAEHHLQFIASPLWRVYTFTYTYGYDLLAPLLAGPKRYEQFRYILTNSVYPELLRQQAGSASGP